MHSETHRLAAVMFTDIVGYTALMQQDRAGAMQAVKQLDLILRDRIKHYGGELVQTYGDGSLSLFESVSAAVRCAKEVQEKIRSQVPLRIGLHIGEVTRDGDHTFGNGVNIASRIESIGVAGAVLFSKEVYDKIRNLPELESQSLGEFVFKNVEEPIEVFALTSQGLVVPGPLQMEGKGRRVARPVFFDRIEVRLIIAVFAMVILGIGIFWMLGKRKPVEERLFPESIREEKVAVSVFENFTGEENLDAFGYLGSEWISSGLRELNIRTVSPEMVRQHKDQIGILPGNPQNELSFAEITGAKYVITGSYFLQGDSLVLNTRLSSTETGEELKNFPQLKGHKDHKEQMVEDARQYLLGYWVLKRDQRLPNISPPKYEAYEAYLKCFVNQPACHRKALALDPDFLLARVALIYGSVAWDSDSMFHANKAYIEERWDRCTTYEKNFFKAAVALAEGNYEAAFLALDANYHLDPNDYLNLNEAAWLASAGLNRPDIAVDRYQGMWKNLELLGEEVNEASIYHYLDALNRMQKYETVVDFYTGLPEVIKRKIDFGEVLIALIHLNQIEKVKALIDQVQDPTMNHAHWRSKKKSAYLFAAYAFACIYPGQDVNPFAEGLRAQLDNFEDPNDALSMSLAYLNWESQAMAHYVLREWTAAEAILLNLQELSWRDFDVSPVTHHQPELWVAGMLGCIYAQQGKREAALAQMEKIQLIGDQHHRNHIAPWFRGAIPYLQARVYAVLGEKEKAVEHLKTAIDQGQLYIWWNVVFDLDFVNLKGYEPFEVLIQPEKPEK